MQHWNSPQKCTGAHWFLQHRTCNICSGPCGLPVLGSNCYVALTEWRQAQPRAFVISEAGGATLQADIRARSRDRCLDICCQTKSDCLPRGREGGESQTLIATICELKSCRVKSGWLSIKSKPQKFRFCVCGFLKRNTSGQTAHVLAICQQCFMSLRTDSSGFSAN